MGDFDIAGLYGRHEAEVLAFFLRRTHEPETAADLAAETFADAVAQIHRGTRVREPRAWLYAIARGKLADFQRRGYVAERARRRLGLERLEWTDDELERVVAAGAGVDLEQALDVLAPEQRDAVIGRIVDGRPYADLARAQQTTETVVRQRVHRGLSRLRHLLKEGTR